MLIKRSSCICSNRSLIYSETLTFLNNRLAKDSAVSYYNLLKLLLSTSIHYIFICESLLFFVHFIYHQLSRYTLFKIKGLAILEPTHIDPLFLIAIRKRSKIVNILRYHINTESDVIFPDFFQT